MNQIVVELTREMHMRNKIVSRPSLREIVSGERKVVYMFSKKTSDKIVSRARTRSALIKLYESLLVKR